MGIGDWGLGPIPNPQSPIPNPQSPLEQKINKLNIYHKLITFNKLFLINNPSKVYLI